jgi:hypothetical protein
MDAGFQLRRDQSFRRFLYCENRRANVCLCFFGNVPNSDTPEKVLFLFFIFLFFSFSGANDVVVFVVERHPPCAILHRICATTHTHTHTHTLQLRCVYSVQWLSATNVPRDFALAHAWPETRVPSPTFQLEPQRRSFALSSPVRSVNIFFSLTQSEEFVNSFTTHILY